MKNIKVVNLTPVEQVQLAAVKQWGDSIQYIHNPDKEVQLTAVRQREIEQSEKIKEQVSKIDICPLCKTKMTEEHLNEVVGNANKDISNSKNDLENYTQNISKFSV